MRWIWFVVVACTTSAPPSVAAEARAYPDVRAGLEADRSALSAAWADAGPDARDAIRVAARRRVLDVVTTDVLPAWYGTPWEFTGTTQTPGEGTIACGYLVSTVLRDTGFGVERVRLAQQPAEYIIETLVPPGAVRRYRTGDVDAVVDGVVADGEGLYLVGLDFHVGFLHHDGDTVRMCHSSYLDPGHVVCEPARSAAAMTSGYHVVGKLLEDPMIDGWLAGDAFPTKVWSP